MKLTSNEHATLHFYQWERRLRGYYHFDVPVELEPYYIPFKHREYVNHHVDDGRVPSLLDSIGKFFQPKELPEPESKQEDLLCYPYKPTTDLVGFSIAFTSDVELQPHPFHKWLHLISVTTTPISFEIIGTVDNIKIQIVSHQNEYERILTHFKAYFPHSIVTPLENVFDIGLNPEHPKIGIVDFGLEQEAMRPLHTIENYHIDSLASILATLNHLNDGDTAILQILFQGVQTPWAINMHNAVSDGSGGSFFSNAPEMPQLAREKTADPLFSVVMRVVAKGYNTSRTQYLINELTRSISTLSSSPHNRLIPLDNEGYEYEQHLRNVFLRCSNRLGFLLNTKELSHFVHYPNKTVVSNKLGILSGKTKELPQEAINQNYSLGINEHLGTLNEVTLNDEMRLRHTHIIGATGVGKSTLIGNMVIKDAQSGNGCAIFDPHGDICEDILMRIPQERLKDVILIDPSDISYPIGFNLLHATTEAEKIVLSSDLVSSFKRHATAWGDNMTAVLSNAINTFLENPNGGTIIELKRFILEEKFRNTFLENVDDPSLHYYWKNEYPMVKKGIAPLLTRIDTFLRPKTVRYMLAQKSGLDFRKCIEEKKILLIKLSQGLIGEENSYLLGSLFLAKLNQVAIGRQSLSKSERHPFYVYLDEFQNFITPSIVSILSGARKYGLGLILAHQELAQIDDSKVLNSVISNPHTRICFRLGDTDSKRLESGFSYFEQDDLQSLSIGEAIMRVGSSSNDFNIETKNLSEVNKALADLIRTQVVEQTRKQYCKTRAEIEQLINNLLPKRNTKNTPSETETKIVEPKEKHVTTNEVVPEEKEPVSVPSDFEQEKEAYLKDYNEKQRSQEHLLLQTVVRSYALTLGYVAKIEDILENGKRIDVTLIRDEKRIAIEIALTNSIEYELNNIQKCIDAGFTLIYVIAPNESHLNNIKKQYIKSVGIKVRFGNMEAFKAFLTKQTPQDSKKVQRVRGYRVTTSYSNLDSDDSKKKQSTISKIILKSPKNKKK